MDPNTALTALRDAIRQWRETGETESAEYVCDYAEALDEWLSRGGFLPADWQR